ncbi:MAG: outer membrane beta-barrel protein [Siphonobacter sp.]
MLRHIPLLSILISIILLTTASAQVLHLKPHFGVRGGLTSGYTIISPKDFVTKFNSGLHLGAFYRARFDRFVVEPELIFTQQGGTIKNATELTRNTFYYATVAPVFGYIITEGLTAEVGPQFAYAINSSGGSPKGPNNRTDYGFTAGVRYDFMDALDKVSMSLRYSRGFNDVTNLTGYTFNNQAIQLSVIYSLYREK